MSAMELNAVARLVMIANRCGSQLLDNAKSFDHVVGRRRFSELDGESLDLARRIVKASLDSLTETRIGITNTPKDFDNDHLHG
jgi:hypothetical protein